MSATGRYLIALAPLQEAFRRSGVSSNELARRLGYVRKEYRPDRSAPTQADQTRVMRELGLRQPSPSTKGFDKQKMRIRADTALRICEALDIDPYRVGL